MGQDLYGVPPPSKESPWLENLKSLSSSAEDVMDSVSQPIRPYIPAIGRFLIVVTFLEDALRIITQWHDQTLYLSKYRGMPMFIAYVFLILNVVVRIDHLSGARLCVVTLTHLLLAAHDHIIVACDCTPHA